MAVKATIYSKTESDGNPGWYFSCCGIEQGPFDDEGTAKAAAALHEFGH